MKIKFSVTMGLFAFLLSTVIGLLVGNLILNLILKALAFCLFFIVLSYGSLEFIERRIPELYQALLNGGYQEDSSGGESEGGTGEQIPGDSAAGGEEEGISDKELSEGISDSQSALSASKQGVEKLGSHILVKDKKIINEPKLMAEAIRHVMAKDSEEK